MTADIGTVPGAVGTLLAFAAFIVPGFLLRAGYVKSVSRSRQQADLHVLAEAIVGSLLVLAVAWWWRGHDVLNWFQAHTLAEHERKTYWFFFVLITAPYFVGLVSGWVVNFFAGRYERMRPPPDDWKSRKSRLFYLLDCGGVFALPTIWDQAWNSAIRGSPLIVRVRTKTGNETVGSYELGAWVGLSPDPYDLYLRRVYRQDNNGEWEFVPDTEGILFREEAIESVEFLWAESPGGRSKRESSGDGQGAE